MYSREVTAAKMGIALSLLPVGKKVATGNMYSCSSTTPCPWALAPPPVAPCWRGCGCNMRKCSLWLFNVLNVSSFDIVCRSSPGVSLGGEKEGACEKMHTAMILSADASKPMRESGKSQTKKLLYPYLRFSSCVSSWLREVLSVVKFTN